MPRLARHNLGSAELTLSVLGSAKVFFFNSVLSLQDTIYQEKLAQLRLLFGDVHHIVIPESKLLDSSDWITDCLARLFVHSRVYHCGLFYGWDGLVQAGLERCPGGCGLRRKPTKEKKLTRKKVRKKKSTEARPTRDVNS